MANVSGSRHAPPPDVLSDIYIDESSQTKHRYLVLGGIIAPTREVDAINSALAIARLPELPFGEMKWNKVSKAKLLAYRRVVDCFFSDPALATTHFHSIVVDTYAQDHAAYNDSDREIGFNKEIYQLASKFARLYQDRLFHLYPDSRETNQRPEDLRTILNFGRRKAGDSREWPFRRSHFRNSKSTPLLQLVDLMIGALAFHLNGHIQEPDASQHKARLATYVLKKARIADPFKDTSIAGRFTIWHRQLKRRGGVPRP